MCVVAEYSRGCEQDAGRVGDDEASAGGSSQGHCDHHGENKSEKNSTNKTFRNANMNE